MNIAVLYRKGDESAQEYPLDYEGRGEFSHVIRIEEALKNLGHNAEFVELNLDTFESLRHSNFDLVFNLCDDGFRNNPLLEAHIPAMLDILEIPFTGSGFLSLATCVNKARTKKILEFHSITTPRFQVFENKEQKFSKELRFPLIVKPLHEDASIGLRKDSVVENESALRKKVELIISEYAQPALVEEFIQGREIYVGMLGSNGDLSVLPLTEINFDKSLPQNAKICTYEAKWVEESDQCKNTPVQCPAGIDGDLESVLIDMARKAYQLMDCQDYGRVDFRVDEDGKPFVLEVNPNPDISEDAGLARMARAKGITYDGLIEKIVESAIKRKQMAKKEVKA